MTKISLVDEIINRAGGNCVLSRRLGICSQAISKWRATGRIPIVHVPVVAEMSGVPRHIIRADLPDLFPPPPRVPVKSRRKREREKEAA